MNCSFGKVNINPILPAGLCGLNQKRTALEIFDDLYAELLKSDILDAIDEETDEE